MKIEEIIRAARKLGKREKNPPVRLWGKILDILQNCAGKCECGCGETTEVTKYTDITHGIVAGRHKRFLKGHGGALATKKKERYAVNPETGCWEWLLATRDGYGITKGVFRGKKVLSAHRVVYEEFKGPIPQGLVLDHLCCNRLCVNPEHLEPVTIAENNRRKFSRKKNA